MATAPRVAVVLSGSGVYDGSEVTEAVATLCHLGRAGAEFQCYAPDRDQMHVVDHTSGEEMPETRNVLKESARIARGNVKPLTDMDVDGYDAIVFPGGFGAAKNLSSFATAGPEMEVKEDVRALIAAARIADKAPVIAAKEIPGVTVTMGADSEEAGGYEWPFAGAAEAAAAMGATYKAVTDPVQAVVDEANKVVTAPAFMCAAPYHVVYDSVGSMIGEVLKLVGSSGRSTK